MVPYLGCFYTNIYSTQIPESLQKKIKANEKVAAERAATKDARKAVCITILN